MLIHRFQRRVKLRSGQIQQHRQQVGGHDMSQREQLVQASLIGSLHSYRRRRTPVRRVQRRLGQGAIAIGVAAGICLVWVAVRQGRIWTPTSASQRAGALTGEMLLEQVLTPGASPQEAQRSEATRQTPETQIPETQTPETQTPETGQGASDSSGSLHGDRPGWPWQNWWQPDFHGADPKDYFAEGILPPPQLPQADGTPVGEGRAASPSPLEMQQPRLDLRQRIPPNTVVWLGGDPSLLRLNQVLRYEFKRRYPGSDIDVRTNTTAEAIRGVLDGSLDVAAISRPLTPAEVAQGLRAVPLARHKIAVLIGNENPFQGSLTNEQLAQILRGEITNWSQVGGDNRPLRLVDRAATSATREALLSYPVFSDIGSMPNIPAGRGDRLGELAAALGPDGITYALIDQVSDDITNPEEVDRGDVKIVPLHQVLPDDPRYSISQPMVYVYRTPNPTAEAFLAYATVLRKRGILADGASLKARSSFLEQGIVRFLLVMGVLGGTAWAIAKLRQRHLSQVYYSGGVGDSADATGWNRKLAQAGVYSDLASSYLILDCPEGELRARWFLSDVQREALPLEHGGSLELRLYEYRPQEAIPAEAIARHHPFRSYPCDGPEGSMVLHHRTLISGARYIAELGYLTVAERWIKVTTSTVVRPPVQNQFSPLVPQGWTS